MVSVPVASRTLEESSRIVSRFSLSAYYVIGVTNQLPPKRIISDSNLLDVNDRKTLLVTELRRLEALSEKFVSRGSHNQSDASVCHLCGSLMTRTGTCYTCLQCGASGGCG